MLFRSIAAPNAPGWVVAPVERPTSRSNKVPLAHPPCRPGPQNPTRARLNASKGDLLAHEAWPRSHGQKHRANHLTVPGVANPRAMGMKASRLALGCANEADLGLAGVAPNAEPGHSCQGLPPNAILARGVELPPPDPMHPKPSRRWRSKAGKVRWCQALGRWRFENAGPAL